MAFRSVESMLLITLWDTSLTRRTLANTLALRINFPSIPLRGKSNYDKYAIMMYMVP